MRPVFSRASERPVADVPAVCVLLLLILLFIQLGWGYTRQPLLAAKQDLPPAPPAESIALWGLGDNLTLARVLTLWLQSFDYQPGLSLSFRELDYGRLVNWLDLLLDLDSRSGYPLLLASRVYAEVNDSDRKRIMLEFVAQKFLEAPNRRWKWLAHAVYVAKYQLKDQELALQYATLLADNVTDASVPHWARQLHIYTLEDMGRIEAARVLIGGLIESGNIQDEHELRFLMQRLESLEERDEPSDHRGSE